MTPFITDAHRDHMATSMALSHIDAALLQRRQICLYQVHSHIPDGLLNRYLGLSDQEQAAKEQALALYISQNMTRRLTLSKYLLFSKVAPQIGKRPQIAGVEHFVMLSGTQFLELAALWNAEQLVRQLKTVNYSPYSFRHFLSNDRLLNQQPLPQSGSR